MNENKKFILVAAIILLIFSGEKIWRKTRESSKVDKEKNYIVKMEKHTYKQVERPLDINSATLEDMLKKKVSMSYANKILEYRDITGGFESVEELTKISGIGEKTYEKLRGKFEVVEAPSKNKININKASKLEMIYIGLSKKEVKVVQEYLEENKIIFDNVIFLELIGEERYHEIGDRIEYH